MKRQAPVDGYDFGSKRHYRRSVWKTASEYFKGQVADKKILIMPSSEGDEIEVAMSKGFRQNNIVICDKNPAIVATLKRQFPLVKTYGVTLERAVWRMVDDGIRVHALNADLCGPVSERLHETLRAIAQSQVIIPGGLLFVTILKGREQTSVHLEDGDDLKVYVDSVIPDDLKNYLSDRGFPTGGKNYTRMVEISNAIYYSGEKYAIGVKHRWTEYKSHSGLVMIWMAMKMYYEKKEGSPGNSVQGYIHTLDEKKFKKPYQENVILGMEIRDKKKGILKKFIPFL